MGCYFSVLGVGILKGICSSKYARKLGEKEEKLEIGNDNIWHIPTPGIELTPAPFYLRPGHELLLLLTSCT